MELLQIDGTLIAVIINFLVLVYLLNRLLFKPVLKVLDERRGHIEQTLDEASRRLQEASDRQQAYETKLREARREAQTILEETRQQAEKTRNELKVKTEQEIGHMKEHAKTEIADWKRTTRDDLKKEVAALIVMGAGKIIEKSIDPATHEVFLNQFASDLRSEHN